MSMQVRMTANRLERENENRDALKTRAKAGDNSYFLSGIIIPDTLSNLQIEGIHLLIS